MENVINMTVEFLGEYIDVPKEPLDAQKGQ